VSTVSKSQEKSGKIRNFSFGQEKSGKVIEKGRESGKKDLKMPQVRKKLKQYLKCF